MAADGSDASAAEEPEPSATGSADRTAVVAPVVEGPPDAHERVGCPACAAPNSPSRVLCGRCGADLETGEVAPRPSTPQIAPTDPTVDLEGRRVVDRRRTRTAIGFVSAVLVVTVVLAVLAAMDRLPFAGGGGSQVPPARFDPAAYPQPPSDLEITRLSTSTTLAAASETQGYDASLMVDDDLETAWNNDGDINPDGVGEVIRVGFDQPVWISSIVIGNGAQQDGDAFAANARLQRAQVTLDGGVTLVVELDDVDGLQNVPVGDPELTTSVRIDVLGVRAGDTYEDLAVSELSVRGYQANERDREIAEQRSEADR